MGDEQGGGVEASLNGADLVTQMAANAGVECSQRFIKQQGLGVDGQRPRQRHALLLAAGKLADAPGGVFGETDGFQHLTGETQAFVFRHLAQLEAIGHVVNHVEVRKEGVLLEDHADIALMHRLAAKVFPVEQDGAAVVGLQPGNELQECRFAGAAGADDRHQLAGFDAERNLLETVRCSGIGVADLIEKQAHVFGKGEGGREKGECCEK